LDAKTAKRLKRQAQEAAEIASATERQALELEREVEKMKKAEYMSFRKGEVFSGIISGVAGYGMYVALPNTIEGFVRADSLMDDYYDYDSGNYRLLGRHTNRSFTLGDKVTVRVRSVNVETREIDFILEEESREPEIVIL